MTNTVPTDDLRALVEQWNSRYDENTEYGPADMYANELEAVIEEHE